PGIASADGPGAATGPQPAEPPGGSAPSTSAPAQPALPLLAPRRTLDERFPEGPPRRATTDDGKRAIRKNRRGRMRYRDPRGRFVATVHPDGRASFRDKGLSVRNRRIMSLYDVILAAQGTELHQTAKRAFLRETYENRLAMRVEWTVGNIREAERRLWGELREIWEDKSKSRLEREFIIGTRWVECDVDVDLTPVDGEVSVVDQERRAVARRAQRTIEHFTRMYIDPDKRFREVTPAHDAAVALAPDLFEACERDATTCIGVGDLLVGRRANAIDPARGARYYARACDADDAWACYELAVLHYLGLGVERDDRLSAELHGVACQAGVPQGCAYLAHLHRKGLGVPRSDEHAVHYRQRACTHGLEDYCAGPGLAASN
ncbi:MAG: tetratricopeptide repeat protein, partial [Myxococcota bacterium]